MLIMFIHNHGYTQTHLNHMMFYKYLDKGYITIFIVYIDDVILIGNDILKLKKLNHIIAREIAIK